MFHYEGLKQNDLFYKIKINNILNDTITAFDHNVWSLLKHIDDIVSDNRKTNNDIIGLILITMKIDF